MYTGKSGQTQVLTAVLLGGILIAGVASAYAWGLPILRKNQDVNNAQQSLSDMRQLAEAVEEVASNGGSRTVQVQLSDGSLDIDTEKDMVTFRAMTRGAYVSTNNWAPLNEDDMQGVNRTTGLPEEGYGVRGVDNAALLIGRAESSSDRYVTFYRIVARDLFEPSIGQTYGIDLRADGNLEVSGGTYDVSLRRGEEVTEAGSGVNGGTLHRREILISVS